MAKGKGGRPMRGFCFSRFKMKVVVMSVAVVRMEKVDKTQGMLWK